MTLKRAPTFAQRLRDFRRVLEMEAKRGYADRAVVGGLGRFLDRWRAELSEEEADSLPPALVAALAQRKYHELSTDLRERWVYEALTALGDYAAASEPLPKPKTVRAIPPRRLAPSPAAPTLESPPTIVRGVGPGIAAKLENLGITNVNGLLRHYPSRHLTVTSVSELDSARRRSPSSARCGASTGGDSVEGSSCRPRRPSWATPRGTCRSSGSISPTSPATSTQ